MRSDGHARRFALLGLRRLGPGLPLIGLSLGAGVSGLGMVGFLRAVAMRRCVSFGA